ncbi:uncharacterized protein DSM5745_06806 [Aspergillus mulundensis]|uniref:Uncharacterized protein n=1 Tax=Aspergillus mulundensis TaxID=1810919 RepID=A0A3D8RSG2_9EURO|nr:hypothetical protein DSM5745_06806 [Aspergillus mulundensis]RDW76814.1 hypothetical protein DSM5745_06806 [Aspergillus mulundensis]
MVVEKLIKGVAAGIGLASESVSAYKANKRERKEVEARASGGSSPRPEADGEAGVEAGSAAVAETEQQLAVEQLEEQWELDEAQDELHDPAHEQSPTANEEELLLWTPPPPPSYTPTTAPKLPYPVILPQRRPKSNKRGFIRAYAPILQDFGIDQKTFLSFLETSNKACQATPWLYALNLASIGTLWLPGAISFAVSTLIQLGTEAAMQVEGRRKTNAYFDKINEEFFRPRGLYCLIMTWEPESDATIRKFDLNTAISTAVDGGGAGRLKKLKHKYKSSHGRTQNELPFPEAAPLIFPGLDAVAASGSETEIKKLKKREFLADYFDRRGRAKFTMENPTSALNMAPKPTFTSRYADPSHPASSGDLLSLVSGGHISSSEIRPRAPEGRRGIAGGRFAHLPGGNIGLRDLPGGGIIHAVASARRGGRGRGRDRDRGHERRYEEHYAEQESGIVVDQEYQTQSQPQTAPYGEYSQGSRGFESIRGARQRGRGGLVGGAKKFLSSNVLYLMIVNRPSEEEMAAAREMFEA